MKRILTLIIGLTLGSGCTGHDREAEVLGSLGQAQSTSGTDVNASNIAGNEAEVLIDINPTNTQNFVIAGHNPGFTILNTFFTTDGGATWTNVPLGPAQDGLAAGTRFDPTVAFDDDGNVYVGYGVSTGGTTTVIVATSTDGGATYSRFTQVAQNVNLAVPGNDKWHLATGPDPVTGLPNVYIAWTQNIAEVGTDQRIVVSRSTDAGQTFSAPTIVNDGSITGTESGNLFADPAVGPNGELYVTWNRIGAGEVRIDVSLDGGTTFGTDILATTSGAGFRQPIPAQPDRGIFVGPVLDADRSGGAFNGRLYLAYVDDADPGAGFDMDIFVRTSVDQGTTWSAPVRVNDDTVAGSDQFLPWLDVDQGNGNVGLVWFDTRSDANEQLVQLFSAASTNGASSFLTNIQVSDGQSNQSVTNPTRHLPQNYLEYLGVASHNCESLAVWPDNSTDPADLDYFTDGVDFGCAPTLADFCVLGENRVQINDRASIVQNGGFGAVANSGNAFSEIGVEADVGDIESVAQVFLRDRSFVHGDVRSGSDVTIQNNVTITGVVEENQTMTLPELDDFLVTFPPLGANVTVPADQTLTLAPGAYGNVSVQPRARLLLSSGTYFFRSLTLEPDSVVFLDKHAGDILIRILSSFTYRGAFEDPGAVFENATIIYQGTSTVRLERRFEGTVIAPLAEIELSSVVAGHEGAFFGENIIVRPDVTLTCRPFTGI